MAAVSLIAVLAFGAILVISYWHAIVGSIKKRQLLWQLPSVPYTAYPIIGHVYLFPKKTNEFFKFVADTLADITHNLKLRMAVVWFGPLPCIFVVHPDAAEVILRSSKHMEKSFLYRFVHPWLGTGLLTSSGEKWKTRRKLITPSFHFNILQDFLDVMNEQAGKMSTKIAEQFKPGENVDLGRKVTLCALDIICETAMGQTVNAQEDTENEYVKCHHRISKIIQFRQRKPHLWWDFLFDRTKDGRDHARVLRVLHGFTRSVIKERQQSKAKKEIKRRMAFLDVLLNAKTEAGESLSFDGIQEEVDTFMFEGHDTTAAAMTWCLYLLGRNPDIQRRVHDELDEVFGSDDRFVTTHDLKNLEYLERVIKESLRLYPSVPFFGRVTTEDCVMDNHFVPKGTQVLVMAYGIHHNPSVWPDPEKFDPDRFATENAAGRHPYAYLPFSAGPRNCIGQKFATMEEKVILSRLLRTYEVTAYDDEKTLPKDGDLILRPSLPLKFTLIKRL